MTYTAEITTLVNHRRFYRSLLVSSIIILVYMLAYSARIQSGDTLRLFDVASSIVRYGDVLRDESAWFIPPNNYVASQPYPIEGVENSEPFATQVLSWHYRIIDMLPNIGLVHGVWTFNILITAATAWVMYWLILLLGYHEPTAFVTPLIFASLTILFPYSKTLFREPLTMFLLLCATTTLLLARHPFRMPWLIRLGWGGIALFCFYLVYQTKISSLVVIPAMALLLIPKRFFQVRFFSLGLIVLGCAVLAILAYIPRAFDLVATILPDQIAGINFSIEFAQVALHTYLFSIGGSLWGTSPIILLGIGGVFYLWQSDRQWLVWFVLTLIASYAIGHALVTDQFWFGGLSWPSRFMLPLIPFAILLCVPVIQHVLEFRQISQGRSRLLLASMACLSLYSAWVQYTAIVLPWGHYPDLLPASANGLIEWTGGLNEVRYLRWVLLPQSLGSLGFDIAWIRAGISGWLGVFLIGIVVLLMGAWRLQSVARPRFGWLLAPIMTCVLVWLSLTSLYDTDQQYLAQEASLHDVRRILHENAQNKEPLFILDQLHSQYFMNYYDDVSPRPIALTIQPGEPADIATELLATGADINQLLDYRTIRQFAHVARHFDRFWFLTDISPFMSGSQRVVERYLVDNFYLADIFTTSDPNVRLLLFDTTKPPQLTTFMMDDYPTDLVFDEAIALTGIALPDGLTYEMGSTLPISLFWRASASVEIDYTIALFLSPIDENNPPIQGIDSPPQAGFAPTNTWGIGQIVWDHRTLRLPLGLPAGNYELWLVLYYNTPEGIQRARITQGETNDDNIGIIPYTITVTVPSP